MRFISENSLNDFEFHDAYISSATFSDGVLTIFAEHMNIHKNTPQNSGAVDMEIKSAKIVFDSFSCTRLEPWKVCITDKNGNQYVKDTGAPLYEEKAQERLLSELEGATVYSLGTDGNNLYYIECGIDDTFTAYFSFEAVTVEWDEYLGKAWYEKAPFNNK